MSARANAINTLGTTQVSGGQVATTQTSITTFPRSGGITLTRLNGELAAAGAALTDVIARDSDGGFWDSTVNTRVPVDCTSLALNGMTSF